MRYRATSTQVCLTAGCLISLWTALCWGQPNLPAPTTANSSPTAIAASASASSSLPKPDTSGPSGETSSRLAKNSCPEAISPENAKRLFDAIKDFHSSDTCKLENVKTERNVITVEWYKDEKLASTVTIVPASCAKPEMHKGPQLAMAKLEDQDHCPEANKELAKTISSDIFGPLVSISENQSPPQTTSRSPLLIVAGVIFMLLTTVLALRLTKPPPKQPNSNSDSTPEDKKG